MFAALVLFSFFLLFLAFPAAVAAGAAEGLLSWYRNVLPVLFPYMVLTGLMVKTGAAEKIAIFFHPLLGRLFSLSVPGTYALLCGLLCGYPMGAAITARLRGEGSISAQEASYLLTIANLPGPSFLAGYVCGTCYADAALPGWSVFAILYFSVFLVSLFTRRLYHMPAKIFSHGRKSAAADHTGGAPAFVRALDEGISEALSSQLKICGCMIFYSSLTALLTGMIGRLGGLLPDTLLYAAGCILEITSGIRRMSEWSASSFSLAVAVGMCAFGGISVAAQTYAVTNDSNKKTRQPLGGYLVCKTLTGIVVFGLLWCARFVL